MTLLYVGTSILACCLLTFVGRIARLSRRNKSVVRESLVGEIGEAQISLAPDGLVTVRSKTYRARGTTAINAGDRVCVIETGEILTVKPYSR
jgi:membrane-bound ClpP family serine protease